MALGAQNIFVLNSGLLKQRHLLVATISSLCDTVLIFVGVLGVASLFLQVPLLKIGLGTLGVAFLVIHGLKKLYEAYQGSALPQTSSAGISSRQAIATSLGFSLLNPHVYLDTVVLVGGYSAQFAQLQQRFTFGLGAAVFSALWFFGLALAAAAARRFLFHPRTMRFVALFSGLLLLWLAWKLGADVWTWAS